MKDETLSSSQSTSFGFKLQVQKVLELIVPRAVDWLVRMLSTAAITFQISKRRTIIVLHIWLRDTLK
jgi:hypothetical protein